MVQNSRSSGDLVHSFINTADLQAKLQFGQDILTDLIGSSSSKSQLLRSDPRCLLQHLTEYLRPDTVRRRSELDCASVRLDLHIVSLGILAELNRRSGVLLQRGDTNGQEIVELIFDLLHLKRSVSHGGCCRTGIQETWDTTTITKAKDLVLGLVCEGMFMADDRGVYEAELEDATNCENVVDRLVAGCGEGVRVNNLAVQLDPGQSTALTVKVVHVLTPEYMWVQEMCDELGEMETDMAEYMATHPVHANPGSHKLGIMKLKKLLFRAEVKRWGASTAIVHATDYGWDVEVSHGCIYQTEDFISDITPFARFCRIINVLPPSKTIQLQKSGIKLLQTFTSNESLVSSLLTNEYSKIQSLVDMMLGTRDVGLIYEILLLFSQLAFFSRHRDRAAELYLKPVAKALRRWFLCPDVVTIGLECLRNLIAMSPRNRESLIFSGGIELALKAHATYSTVAPLHAHVLHVLKCCLQDYTFSEQQDYQTHDITKLTALALDDSEGISPEFSHLGNMSQYNIRPGHSVSFLDSIGKPSEFLLFAREVVSHLNNQSGGTIYIGVTHQGIINGIQMNRSRKDDTRNKIDGVLTKMICDYKMTELPNRFFDCTFERVTNTHKRALPPDSRMYIVKVSISRCDLVARVRVGEDTVFFGRNNGRIVPIQANEIRQILAEYLTVSNTNQIQNHPTNRDSIFQTSSSSPTTEQYDTLRQPLKCTSPPPLQLLGSLSPLSNSSSPSHATARDPSQSAPTSRESVKAGSPPTLHLRKPRNVPRQTAAVQPFADSDTGAVSPFTVPDVFGMVDKEVQGRTEVAQPVRRGPPPLVSIIEL